MINNKLTYHEFESFIKSIVKLENTETIFEIVSKIFHLPNYKQLFCKRNSEDTGIKTTYNGFEIEVKNFKWGSWVNSVKYEDSRIIVEFKKKKMLIDDFINPTNKIVNDLKRICINEIRKLQLCNYSYYGMGIDNKKLEILYQDKTFNPNSDWEKHDKISPLTIAKTIIREKGRDFYIIDFLLTAECYERDSDKTTLKKDWQEIFKNSAPMWI